MPEIVVRVVGAFIVLAMSRVKYQSDCSYTGLNYKVFIIQTHAGRYIK